MNRFLVSIAFFAALICFSSTAVSKELIKEFKGSESTTTAEFEVRAPWIADWRVTGDYPGQMALNVNLVGALTGEYEGKIVTTKYVSNGVRLFDEGGVYRFQVNSSLVGQWTLRVEELTRAEAETYKPKESIE
jgi:hypothetical protein